MIPRSTGLDHAVTSTLMAAAESWLTSTLRPRPTPEGLRYWNLLIDEWVENPNFPLLIRKAGDRGVELLHPTGRSVVCVDNSPAHWTMASAIHGEPPPCTELLAALVTGEWPVTFAMSKAEVAKQPRFRGVLARSAIGRALNHGEWKVCHIDEVGLHSKATLKELSIAILKEHCRRLLKPSNMFLVPNSHAGFGELPEVIAAFRRDRG